MNLAWRFWDVVVLSRSHHAAFSKKTGSTPRALQKHLAISPIPLPFIAAP
jgi:hypothetical protein